MKVLLVRPKPDKETIGLQNVMICEPLELEYLATYAQELGHEVNIVDMILEKKPLAYYISKFQPDIVGITAYIVHINVVKSYAKQIKDIKPNCKVVIGGVHAEVVPSDFKDENIDYIICANGIDTFSEILHNLSNNIEQSIDGVWIEGTTAKTIKHTHFNYLRPNRKLVERYRNRYYYMFHNPCALMKTSFGCPYQCKFCFCRQITDGKYFVRELSDIIEEIKEITETEIYIVDDDFLVSRERIMQFCGLLKENKLDKKFLIYGRADFVAANEDIIKEFASCGLRAVIVGLESSNEDELLAYNKQSNVHINEAAIKILKKYNVECYGTLILGVDWDSNDFKRLYKWIKHIDIKFINLQPITPLPGTALYDEYKELLIISRDEAEKWDLAHLTIKPSKMSIRRYYWNIVKLYYKITMSPKNILIMIRQYGISENIKLFIGASKITAQYLVKMIKAK